MIFIENYKGFDIFFNKESNEFQFEHEALGIIDSGNCKYLKQDIDKFSESRYINPVRAYDVRNSEGYVDIFGFDKEGNYVVKYENGHISRMVSSASDNYYLEESKGIIEEIKECNSKIDDLNNTVKDLRKRVKTISTLV